jgi:hypothetical protein
LGSYTFLLEVKRLDESRLTKHQYDKVCIETEQLVHSLWILNRQSLEAKTQQHQQTYRHNEHNESSHTCILTMTIEKSSPPK